MAWFSKKTKRIEAVPPEERVVKTENVFVKCEGCETHLYKGELEDGMQVCKNCGYHFRLGARERLRLLFDEGKFEELDGEVISIDPLEFVDSKPYSERIEQARESSGLPEAIISARGTVGDHPVVAGAMDMTFIGGSMGSAVGEKVTRLIERAMEEHSAVVIFSASGGARMQEGTLSLMQMAKISAALAALEFVGGYDQPPERHYKLLRRPESTFTARRWPEKGLEHPFRYAARRSGPARRPGRRTRGPG